MEADTFSSNRCRRVHVAKKNEVPGAKSHITSEITPSGCKARWIRTLGHPTMDHITMDRLVKAGRTLNRGCRRGGVRSFARREKV